MVTKRTQAQKDISSIAVRRGVSAKRYLPETTPSIKEKTNVTKGKAAGVDINTTATRQRVERKAYELYAQRGYANGNDLQDWLTAEQVIAQELSGK